MLFPCQQGLSLGHHGHLSCQEGPPLDHTGLLQAGLECDCLYAANFRDVKRIYEKTVGMKFLRSFKVKVISHLMSFQCGKFHSFTPNNT